MNELVGGLGYAVKNWWMSLLLGLLYIAVALCLLFAPVSSYVALSVIFSISILVSGILEIFFAVGNKKIINSWGWYLAGGIIDLLIGIYFGILSAGKHGTDSVYRRILAYVQRIHPLRLFHRPETLRHQRLGMVSGIRHSGHFMFHGYHLATGTRSSHCTLYAVRYFPHYRLFPYHFLV